MIVFTVDSVNGNTEQADYRHYLSSSGNLLDLKKSFTFCPDDIHTQVYSLWRYAKAIPAKPLVSFNEGFTPLLVLKLWGNRVLIKQEQLFSTGSYKDRGATVLMSKAKEWNIKKVVQDSSGNAGCAIAAYAAAAGIECHIFLPNDTSPGKIVQMQAYGAQIHRVAGNRKDAANAALMAAESAFYASHCYNPYFYEGTKTFAYEVLEQLGWNAPDAVVLPAGNGTLVLGCYIAFTELAELGVISKIPKLIGVQAAACDPLYEAFANNLPSVSNHFASLPTIAEGIAISDPIRGAQMLQAIRHTNGCVIAVNENEIEDAWKYCAASGFYIEPTSAATIAGLKQYMQNHPSEKIVSLFSGHGLKSTDKALKILR